MHKEYKDSKFIGLIFLSNSLILIGLPVALFIEGKIGAFPEAIAVVFVILGLLFTRATTNSFFKPSFRIVDNKLYVRRFLKDELVVRIDETWKVGGDGDLIVISKNKQLFGFSKFSLGKNQFKDLLLNLTKIAKDNSNQKLQLIQRVNAPLN